MNFNQIKDLIEFCAEKKVYEVEVEDEGVKLRIQTLPPQQKVRLVTLSGETAPAAPLSASPTSPAPEASFTFARQDERAAMPASEEKRKETKTDDELLMAIKSPMVGTLFHAPAPDAETYVKVGDVVNAETVLCIIEAMKLMNEIKAEVHGKIVRILVENGQPVEYGQPLFLVEPL